ncbi:hypothetical protein ACFFRR_006731 [Megaselia abdita]
MRSIQIAVLLTLVITTIINVSNAASECWFSNCNNSTTCPEDVLDCTPQIALDSVNYLKKIYDNAILNSSLSSSYDCFTFGTNTSVYYSDGSEEETYTLYRSCIPRNVKVCDLGNQNRKRRSPLIISGNTCLQCKENLCNGSVKLFSMWSIFTILLALVISQKVL